MTEPYPLYPRSMLVNFCSSVKNRPSQFTAEENIFTWPLTKIVSSLLEIANITYKYCITTNIMYEIVNASLT